MVVLEPRKLVSELAAGKENLPGGAGESLRRVLEFRKRGPPVHVVFYYLRRYVSSQNHSAPQFQVSEELKDLDITWDLDSLMSYVREGENRVAFIADQEAAALFFFCWCTVT